MNRVLAGQAGQVVVQRTDRRIRPVTSDSDSNLYYPERRSSLAQIGDSRSYSGRVSWWPVTC